MMRDHVLHLAPRLLGDDSHRNVRPRALADNGVTIELWQHTVELYEAVEQENQKRIRSMAKWRVYTRMLPFLIVLFTLLLPMGSSFGVIVGKFVNDDDNNKNDEGKSEFWMMWSIASLLLVACFPLHFMVNRCYARPLTERIHDDWDKLANKLQPEYAPMNITVRVAMKVIYPHGMISSGLQFNLPRGEEQNVALGMNTDDQEVEAEALRVELPQVLERAGVSQETWKKTLVENLAVHNETAQRIADSFSTMKALRWVASVYGVLFTLVPLVAWVSKTTSDEDIAIFFALPFVGSSLIVFYLWEKLSKSRVRKVMKGCKGDWQAMAKRIQPLYDSSGVLVQVHHTEVVPMVSSSMDDYAKKQLFSLTKSFAPEDGTRAVGVSLNIPSENEQVVFEYGRVVGLDLGANLV